MLKYALAMDMPDGKMPGYYAQIVKALAGAVTLFDREKELLVVESQTDIPALEAVLSKYKVGFETMRFWLLPEESDWRDSADDYGFEARSGNRYLNADLVSLYGFQAVQPEGAEPEQAAAQLNEYVLASYADDLHGITVYAIVSHLRELVERTASAYRCKVEWRKPEER